MKKIFLFITILLTSTSCALVANSLSPFGGRMNSVYATPYGFGEIALNYGCSVASSMDGRYIIVGADNEGGARTGGMAYILERPVNGLQTNMSTPYFISNDQVGLFGQDVAISTNGVAIISGSEAVCIYTNDGTTWRLAQTITNTGEPKIAVDISADGSNFLLGLPASKTAMPYRWVATNGYSEQIALSELDTVEFGYDVALSADGQVALIGDPGQYGNRGNAFFFTNMGANWQEVDMLELEKFDYNDRVGVSVDLSADAYCAVVGTENAGRVIYLTRTDNPWGQALLIEDLDSGTVRSFGQSVAISPSGTNVLVGAPLDSDYRREEGSVYEFGITGVDTLPQLVFFNKFCDRSHTKGGHFGASVAYTYLDPVKAIFIGSPGYKDGDGTLYFYDYSGSVTNL